VSGQEVRLTGALLRDDPLDLAEQRAAFRRRFVRLF